ncbi:hypothetical protein, partial [uncultured Duncaniella sp.]|uniref:hypothetical protein n=1 Tax=uncultured Duncaniella sp. TaxID=2768039 RepID=UPI00261101A5
MANDRNSPAKYQFISIFHIFLVKITSPNRRLPSPIVSPRTLDPPRQFSHKRQFQTPSTIV